MTIQVEKGDYLIGKVAGSDKRTVLFKAESMSKGVVTGTVQKDAHIKDKNFQAEIPIKDLVVNLGSDPHPGKVHGHDVSSLYKGRRTHADFGPLYWFYDAEKEVRDAVDRGFDKAYKSLKAQRLGFVVQPLSCIWEIMPYNGEKWAGMYKRSSNVDKNPHRFQVRPEIMPSTEYPYVIHHEVGHHIHYEFLMDSKKLNAGWIKAFNTSIVVRSIKKEQSEKLLNEMLGQGDVPSAFKSTLDEDNAAAFKLILSYISREHSVTVKELDVLFEAEYFDEIKGVWPIRGVPKKDLEPIVSEYATKNYRELFAESFAFRMTGKKLPQAIEKLLDKSLEYVRTNHGQG